MAGRQSLIVTGIKDIDRKLKRLEPRVQKKVVRQSMRAGLKVLAAAVKAEAPVDTGVTRDSVKVRAVKRRKRGSIELEVRIEADDRTKKTSQKTGETVFYPAVVEYGHGNVPPNPFMRRAFEAEGEHARQVTLEKLRDGVEREASARQ